MKFLRGQIYRVNLEPTKGGEQQGDARPCVVFSITPFNNKLRTVGIIPLSSSPRPLSPLIVPTPSAGKPDSVALCHQLRVADKSRFGKYAFSREEIVRIGLFPAGCNARRKLRRVVILTQAICNAAVCPLGAIQPDNFLPREGIYG